MIGMTKMMNPTLLYPALIVIQADGSWGKEGGCGGEIVIPADGSREKEVGFGVKLLFQLMEAG